MTRDLCVSSLRRGHANLLCIVPILTDDPRRESECCASRFRHTLLEQAAARAPGGAGASGAAARHRARKRRRGFTKAPWRSPMSMFNENCCFGSSKLRKAVFDNFGLLGASQISVRNSLCEFGRTRLRRGRKGVYIHMFSQFGFAST